MFTFGLFVVCLMHLPEAGANVVGFVGSGLSQQHKYNSELTEIYE